MKKLQGLGKVLNRDEQKRISGGGESLPCNGGMLRCACEDRPGLFYCCLDFLTSCLEFNRCSIGYGCTLM
jgi:hypothetical protein